MKGFVNQVKISADANGNVPDVIELLQTGHWETPWHGEFEITTEDLYEFAAHFSEGIGLVASDKQAPINYGHFQSGEAAGWITSVEVSQDGHSLLGHVDWTDEAREAIKAKKWKYISPEFNPRSWPWEDPEEEYRFVKNVIDGAALTNIPLFKKLKPITASRLPNRGMTADKQPNEGEHDMNIADILAKAAADRTDEEKAYLDEHKDELTEEQSTQLADEAKPADPAPKEGEGDDPKPGGVTASVNAITETELAQLRADAQAGREAKAELEKTRATALVKEHITAGRIKSDQLNSTVNMLLASKGDARTTLETFLGNLPGNPLMASEEGHGGEGEDNPSANLTDDEKKLARAFGNTEDEVAATKKEEAQA